MKSRTDADYFGDASDSSVTLRLKETLDVLSDPELVREIRRSEKFYAAGKKGLTFENVFGEPLVPVRKRRRG